MDLLCMKTLSLCMRRVSYLIQGQVIATGDTSKYNPLWEKEDRQVTKYNDRLYKIMWTQSQITKHAVYAMKIWTYISNVFIWFG